MQQRKQKEQKKWSNRQDKQKHSKQAWDYMVRRQQEETALISLSIERGTSALRAVKGQISGSHSTLPTH